MESIGTITLNGKEYNLVPVEEKSKSPEELEEERIAKLPKTWEESIKVGTKIIMRRKLSNSLRYEYTETNISDSDTWGFNKSEIIENDLAITNNKKYFSATTALTKLIWLRDIYNGDWKPKLDGSENYPCISYTTNGYQIWHLGSTHRMLMFKTDVLAKLFLENFKDLIEQTKDLY